MLKIVTAPNFILSQSARKISKIDKSILKLIKEMKVALNAAKDPIGVGLAAPQVGHSLRMFVVKPTEKSKIEVFINPQITYASSEKSQEVNQSERTKKIKEKSGISSNKMLEGCLSLVNIWGEVARQKEVKLSYLDENGKKRAKLFKGFPAIVAQHEIDHLDGILFPKRVLEQKGKLYKSHKDEKGEDVFEEIEI